MLKMRDACDYDGKTEVSSIYTKNKTKHFSQKGFGQWNWYVVTKKDGATHFVLHVHVHMVQPIVYHS